MKEEEKLARLLILSADMIHEKILKEIEKGLSSEMAWKIFKTETALRSNAMSLYTKDIGNILDNVDIEMSHILTVTRRAKIAIKKMGKIESALGILESFVKLITSLTTNPLNIQGNFETLSTIITDIQKEPETNNG